VLAGSALVAGIAVADNGWQRGFDRTSELASPIAASAESVSAGRAIYQQRCLPCHGPRGRGDGPAGAALDPRPADLVLHVPQHPDGELFYFISRGIPGSAMPAWRDVLSETERWEVVTYLRALAQGAP
jgi:mono/diheme cytochrome c family protein